MPRRRRSAQPRAIVLPGLAALAAVATGVLASGFASEPPEEMAAPIADSWPSLNRAPSAPQPPEETRPRSPKSTSATPLSRFANADGRYSLSYPADWYLTTSQSRTQITSTPKE